LELNQLRYFCAVARTGSFTRAAEAERVAQPSLSQQIRRLERDLGVPLFERLGRVTRLTPFGEAFLAEAQSVLRHVSSAESAVAELRDGSAAAFASVRSRPFFPTSSRPVWVNSEICIRRSRSSSARHNSTLG
jgi:DNA-binding transcriptional LysR family regulator